MYRAFRIVLLYATVLISSVTVFAQRDAFFGAAPPAQTNASFGGLSGPFIQSYFYPFDWYGGYFSPFLYLPSQPNPYPYLPNHWWTSPYQIADPRQEGYNPKAGYPSETVTTLLLTAYPAKSRVTLDGVFVGTSDVLGPVQLPIGEHTLRVEASGYEPSETIVSVEQPSVERLEVRLAPKGYPARPAPRS